MKTIKLLPFFLLIITLSLSGCQSSSEPSSDLQSEIDTLQDCLIQYQQNLEEARHVLRNIELSASHAYVEA